ncbi:bifunctional (p)ppGpp synthetase/guanosine-3',5'-bis(diphosphate) 3'-pyrophosphohydrolase [uncultured Thiohalocapsa sp.]|uniref:RelA/SpoT family protein n=1 Tax=uncultured Thiohalocapsa sp. TaxID=768990 RepID=UPI0025FFBB6C|nr:bifunctional (p)ppGpp synthetase/guanosine-3',5'-bis(diphosphate) 3'-pyrophosphohydrolase [uncultured Thiohalocapsa sp.]
MSTPLAHMGAALPAAQAQADAPAGRRHDADQPAADTARGGAPTTTSRRHSPTPASAPRKPRYLISDLCAELDAYLPPEQVSEVYRAYLYGAEAHAGQQRQSGEPYIYHPIAVARILAELRMDHKCLIAAMLHDVLEDTGKPKSELAALFDDEVAELVDGVSKLTQIDFPSRAEAQAANFRKMMLAMTRDIRVILIKLADRLHNMRTLGVMAPEKRRRISRETLEIYAPIANRLGINSLRLELEDLGFRHLWPWRHRVLEGAVRRARQHQRELVANVETAVRRRLHQEEIDAEVSGREKHLFSIYRKMHEQAKSFKELVDVFAFRVVVERVDDCYRVLGQVHNLYKPVPGKFKDYIAIPKSNGYQSLHTVLVGPQGSPIEVQIRTRDMHRIADAGIAAHWLYKNAAEGVGAKALADDWLQNLLEMQRDSGDSQEFLEHVKIDLFPDEVYVFTPKGRILVLPKGATVVDFAYAIHSDVGNTCVAARIDRRLSPLRTPLRSGQTVEIINAPGAKPNAAWLNFVVTGKARANVRSYLKNLQAQEAEVLGRRMLNAELARFGLDVDDVGESVIGVYAREVQLDSPAALFTEIGLGNRLPLLVARRLAGVDNTGAETAVSEEGSPRRLAIRGTEGMVVNLARCCRPIPGDAITGLFSPGKGIVIHRCECRNLGEFQSKRDKWLDVEWSDDPKAEFQTEIRVEVGNRRGALATIAAAIAEQGSNIEYVNSREKDGITSTLDFTINVHSRAHLANIMRRLRQIPLVVRISRLAR